MCVKPRGKIEESRESVMNICDLIGVSGANIERPGNRYLRRVREKLTARGNGAGKMNIRGR